MEPIKVNKPPSRWDFLAALALLLALVWGCALRPAPVRAADGEGLTPAGAQVQAYPPDKQVAAYRLACDGSDVVSNVGAISAVGSGMGVAPFSVAGAAQKGGRQTLSLSLRFTNASATATVWVAYYYRDATGYYRLLGLDQNFAGGAVATIGATAATDTTATNGSTRYLANTAVWDAYGATHAQVFVTAVSAGTVDLWVGSY